MTITPQQVAYLNTGDVVRVTVEGPLKRASDGELSLSTGQVLAWPGGTVASWVETHDLVVVSRAPRPLYVNCDRTEPVPGDVVRDADSDSDRRTWVRNAEGFSHEWMTGRTHLYVPRENLPDRLRLLVDGETGQVIP